MKEIPLNSLVYKFEVLRERVRARIATAIRRFIEKIDFWSLRRTDGGSLVSRWQQVGLTRPELREAVTEVVPIHTHVRDFTYRLIPFAKLSQWLTIEGGPEPLQDLVAWIFLDRPPRRARIFPSMSNSIDDLLRGIAWQLMVHGNAALVTTWNQPEKWVAGEGSPQFRSIDSSLVSIAEPGSSNSEIYVSIPRGYFGGGFETIEVTNNEIVFLEWPLESRTGSNSGVSPVDRAVDSFRKSQSVMEAQLLVLESHASQEKKEFRYQRARWQDPTSLLERSKELDLICAAELYSTELNRMRTQYFDVYQFLKLQERLAIVREYLVGRLNVVVARFCWKAGYREIAQLRILGYPSSASIQGVIQQFTNKTITAEDAVSKVSHPDKL